MKYIITYIGLFLTLLMSLTESPAQWIQKAGTFNIKVNCLVVSDTNIFAGTDNGVFLSSNNGINWDSTNTGLAGHPIDCFVFMGTSLFATDLNDTIYCSTNYGGTWQKVGKQNYFHHLSVVGTNLFAVINTSVYRSTNYGLNWSLTDSVLYDVTSLLACAYGGGDTSLIAGDKTDGRDYSDFPCYYGRIHRSTDNGNSWRRLYSEYDPLQCSHGVNDLFAYPQETGGSHLFANQEAFMCEPMFRTIHSTNDGMAWSAVNTLTSIQSIAVTPRSSGGMNVFAGHGSQGVFLSTDDGTSWTSVSSGLPSVNALAVSGTNLFAGTNNGIWFRPLSQMITAVEDHGRQSPSRLLLGQNYPNPFNPTTNISFSLSKRSFVSLKIFDLLGREIALILSEELSAGSYTRTWDAKGLPSGVYFYCLQTGTYTELKKLVLLR